MRRTMGLGACGFLAIAVPVAFGIVRMIPLQGQILHATGPLPSFEVATIKPWVRPAPPPSASAASGRHAGHEAEAAGQVCTG